MDEWKVLCSDDENAGNNEFYEPSDPSVMINLYEAILKGEIPRFDAPIYPRAKPDSETSQSAKLSPETTETLEKTPEKVPSEVTEFDFDTQPEDNVKKFTPRRTPNRPVTKKVGKMSNVFSDIMKYKKMDEKQCKGEREPQAN
uniref:uncharacterized protein LOC120347505 n=1 Tax=Styela clava TaxID=7725 RepID=UPI0019396CDD|nr:uncharacterized protein LOC120347505 [Styela clava]